MSDYIKRDDVKYALNGACVLYNTETIDRISSADVVEVVRCKDCKYRVVNEHYGEKGYLPIKAYCDRDTDDIFELGRDASNDDWFCADGERKEE